MRRVVNGGFGEARAAAALAAAPADLVSFGIPFLANPDRLRATGAPFHAPDQATFYGEGPRGYADDSPLAA